MIATYIVKVRPPEESPYNDPEKMREVDQYFENAFNHFDQGYPVLFDAGIEDDEDVGNPPKKYRDGTFHVFVDEYVLTLVVDVLRDHFHFEIVGKPRKERE